MRPLTRTALSLLAVVGLSGCELAGDLVEFGFWGGVVLVVVVVGVIALAAKLFGGRK